MKYVGGGIYSQGKRQKIFTWQFLKHHRRRKKLILFENRKNDLKWHFIHPAKILSRHGAKILPKLVTLPCKQVRVNKELSYRFEMDVPTEENTKNKTRSMKAEKVKEHKIYLT